MKATPRAHTHGFTLVELSIVLIIIGLLVGGIVGLRSYLNNAKLTTTMNEAKYFISAFNQFQTRYNAPPGDYTAASTAWSNAAGAAAGNGDGNGLIRAVSPASSVCGTANCVEWFYAFQHLAYAGFIQGTFTGTTTGGGGTYYAKIGTNIPGASADNVGFLFDHPDAPDGDVSGETLYFDTTDAGIYGNTLIVAWLSDTATGIPNGAFLTPKQALQLDEKYDDGAPGKGGILAAKSTTNCYTSVSLYNVTTSPDSKVCYFVLKIQ